jgi:hypothetical protein
MLLLVFFDVVSLARFSPDRKRFVTYAWLATLRRRISSRLFGAVLTTPKTIRDLRMAGHLRWGLLFFCFRLCRCEQVASPATGQMARAIAVHKNYARRQAHALTCKSVVLTALKGDAERSQVPLKQAPSLARVCCIWQSAIQKYTSPELSERAIH